MHPNLINTVNVAAQDVLLTPEEIKQRLPMTDSAETTVERRKQGRLLAKVEFPDTVIGPVRINRHRRKVVLNLRHG